MPLLTSRFIVIICFSGLSLGSTWFSTSVVVITVGLPLEGIWLRSKIVSLSIHRPSFSSICFGINVVVVVPRLLLGRLPSRISEAVIFHHSSLRISRLRIACFLLRFPFCWSFRFNVVIVFNCLPDYSVNFILHWSLLGLRFFCSAIVPPI